MTEFDVATGMYESALNALLTQLYNALYPNFLKEKINVGEVGISYVDSDIQGPPTVSLAPSADAKAHIAAAFETLYNAQRAKAGVKAMAVSDKSAILDIASSATFTVNVSKLALTVNYSNGSSPTKIPSAALVVHAMVSVDGSDSNLTFKLLGGTVTVPSDPTLTQLLNKAFLPYLIGYLNKKIFSPIKIPPLGYKSLHLSAPLPVVQQKYLTAFSALGSTPPNIPAPLPWPKDGVYIAADNSAMEAAAGIIFPLKGREKFSWDIISGHVGATVNSPKISHINADGGINASIEANASCQLTLHTPWPHHNVSFDPSATAGLSCTLRPLVEGRELKVVIESTPTTSFSFDWGLPSSINWLFSPLEAGLAAAINDTLGRLIADALRNLEIPILQIPVIPIDFGGGKKISIAIDEATPRGLNGSLLVVSAQATVYK